MQVSDNVKIKGIKSGVNAMRSSGAQPGFIAANILQAQSLNCAVILRAGDPPQYNKRRSSKSGVNLSKTSKQGFFKGALAKEERFARLVKGINGVQPLKHNQKDTNHLKLPPTNPNYQHCMQLDINMQDIIREVGPKGDLKVLGFDEASGLLRLGYRENTGPPRKLFDGQFIVNLNAGDDTPQFFSRDWDRPESKPNWEKNTGVIKQPQGLKAIPESTYSKVFNHNFKLYYTEKQITNPKLENIKKAEVFANRPRDVKSFKKAMGKDHHAYNLIKNKTNLEEILKELSLQKGGDKIILSIYDKGGSIVAGDWDGMALGHPPSLEEKYKRVINTFSSENGIYNQRTLMSTSEEYLQDIKEKARAKKKEGKSLTAFEKQALSIGLISEIVSEFALARAGCITAHEFVFQQILNHAYRDKSSKHYGESFDMGVIQNEFDRLLNNSQVNILDKEYLKSLLVKRFSNKLKHNHVIIEKLALHVLKHLTVAKKKGVTSYKIPHIEYDVNVRDLYQHGFDMRNPYGSNLDGAWLLVCPDGGILYGDTQEQLIEVILTGDFLKDNMIDVNHGADFSVGWGRVIERQIKLGQKIPEETNRKYQEFLKKQEKIISKESAPDQTIDKSGSGPGVPYTRPKG